MIYAFASKTLSKDGLLASAYREIAFVLGEVLVPKVRRRGRYRQGSFAN